MDYQASTQMGMSQQVKPTPSTPGMVEQLQARRQALLVELRDTEQALESLAAHPEFEQIMQRILRAHRF